MELSKRLDIVYSLMEKDLDSVDVGCDHGYLGIKYALNNCGKVYFVDNKIEPLNSAKSNIHKFKLDDKAICILSDGLDKFDKPFTQLTICGMGGNNIVEIITKANNEHKLDNCDSIIVQPNNNIDEVRKLLNLINYKITNEEIIEDGGYFYEIIKFKKGHQSLNSLDIKFGPILRKNKNEFFSKKWIQFSNYLESVLAKIPADSNNKNKIKQLEKEIKIINKEIIK